MSTKGPLRKSWAIPHMISCPIGFKGSPWPTPPSTSNVVLRAVAPCAREAVAAPQEPGQLRARVLPHSILHLVEASALLDASGAHKHQQGSWESRSANVAFPMSRPAPQERDSSKFGLLTVGLCRFLARRVFQSRRCVQTLGGVKGIQFSKSCFFENSKFRPKDEY